MPKRIKIENVETRTHPLKLIRTVKDLKVADISKIFMVTPAYINAIENGTKVMADRSLYFGLKEMNITVEDYKDLSEYREKILASNLSNDMKINLLFIKALSISASDEEIREEAKEMLKK